jgi:hypothetical protein
MVTRASSLPDARPATAVPGQYPLMTKPTPNNAPPASWGQKYVGTNQILFMSRTPKSESK